MTFHPLIFINLLHFQAILEDMTLSVYVCWLYILATTRPYLVSSFDRNSIYSGIKSAREIIIFLFIVHEFLLFLALLLLMEFFKKIRKTCF